MSVEALTAERVDDVEFWRQLYPEFNIDADLAPDRFPVRDPDALLERIRVEGYVRVPGVVPDETVAATRRCIERLYEAGIPVAFAFLYDELWGLFQSVATYVETLLGGPYLMMPDFWAWYVVPSEEATGWEPHRDRNALAVDEDNTPRSLTVWLALSEATTLNGCIHVLPARHDDRFTYHMFRGEGADVVFRPQNIRALPAAPGTLMAWNQNLLHWGGRASSLAEGPRCSVGMPFQRADLPPVRVPAVDPSYLPTFRDRLGLIGKQILQTRDRYAWDPDMVAIARFLWQRFLEDIREELADEAEGSSET